MTHKPVLLKEVIKNLNLTKGLVVLDATLNRGGHAKEIAKLIGSTGIIIGLDKDGEAIEEAKKNLERVPAKVILETIGYENLSDVLATHKIKSIDRALFDLGLSSNQLEESGRGFSFQKDEPLVMTFSNDPSRGAVTAREVVNNWSETTLADIFWGFGNEKFSKRIAKKIVEARENQEINTTGELVDIIASVLPSGYRRGKIHYATRVFQAIRMAVNDELNTIKKGLEETFKNLAKGGELLVISFHEGEDRVVKQFMKQLESEGLGLMSPKKPIVPSEIEQRLNVRSRSAKLRILKKL